MILSKVMSLPKILLIVVFNETLKSDKNLNFKVYVDEIFCNYSKLFEDKFLNSIKISTYKQCYKTFMVQV